MNLYLKATPVIPVFEAFQQIILGDHHGQISDSVVVRSTGNSFVDYLSIVTGSTASIFLLRSNAMRTF
jgi:hypothetical protein